MLSAIRQSVSENYDVIDGNVRAGLYAGYPLARLLRKPFAGSVIDILSDVGYLL
jgi:hypothetical protein